MDGKEDLHHNLGDHEECDSEDEYEEADEYFENLYYSDAELEEESDFLEENTYTVLTEDDISQRQEEEIEKVCSILSISKDEAGILLLHFKWNVRRVIDGWFEEDIRRDLGLLETRVSEVDPNSVMVCGVCNDSYCISEMSAGTCGHYFCNGCWLKWIQEKIDEAGAGCLKLKCLESSCECSMGHEMVLSLLVSCEERYLKMYRQYLINSYVESNRTIKWCPAPDCKYAVQVGNYGSGSGSYEVTCKCSHEFCWNCLEEPHCPVNCDTLKRWMSIDYEKNSILKTGDNEKTEKWKLINTKPCPKCKSPIFKDGGYNHTTCAFPCCFQFCWFCLGNWLNDDAHSNCAESNHNAHYDCVEYDESEYGEVERKRKEEYYYEHWAANESCRAKALFDMQLIQELRDSQCQFDHQTNFERDAWLTIVKCRRVLKWTYAYEYYHVEDLAKMKLFEYLQALAEEFLTELHEYAKQGFICHEMSQQEYFEFRDKLIKLTYGTAKCFKILIKECNLDKPSI